MQAEIHVLDDPIDVTQVIRQRFFSEDINEASLYICNVSDIIKKCNIWKQQLPRVQPFYGLLGCIM